MNKNMKLLLSCLLTGFCITGSYATESGSDNSLLKEQENQNKTPGQWLIRIDLSAACRAQSPRTSSYSFSQSSSSISGDDEEVMEESSNEITMIDTTVKTTMPASMTHPKKMAYKVFKNRKKGKHDEYTSEQFAIDRVRALDILSKHEDYKNLSQQKREQLLQKNHSDDTNPIIAILSSDERDNAIRILRSKDFDTLSLVQLFGLSKASICSILNSENIIKLRRGHKKGVTREIIDNNYKEIDNMVQQYVGEKKTLSMILKNIKEKFEIGRNDLRNRIITKYPDYVRELKIIGEKKFDIFSSTIEQYMEEMLSIEAMARKNGNIPKKRIVKLVKNINPNYIKNLKINIKHKNPGNIAKKLYAELPSKGAPKPKKIRFIDDEKLGKTQQQEKKNSGILYTKQLNRSKDELRNQNVKADSTQYIGITSFNGDYKFNDLNGLKNLKQVQIALRQRENRHNRHKNLEASYYPVRPLVVSKCYTYENRKGAEWRYYPIRGAEEIMINLSGEGGPTKQNKKNSIDIRNKNAKNYFYSALIEFKGKFVDHYGLREMHGISSIETEITKKMMKNTKIVKGKTIKELTTKKTVKFKSDREQTKHKRFTDCLNKFGISYPEIPLSQYLVHDRLDLATEKGPRSKLITSHADPFFSLV